MSIYLNTSFFLAAFMVVFLSSGCKDFDPDELVDGDVVKFTLLQDGFSPEKVEAPAYKALPCYNGMCVDTDSGYHVRYQGGEEIGIGCRTAPTGCWWRVLEVNGDNGQVKRGNLFGKRRKMSFEPAERGDFLLLNLYNWPEDHSEWVLVWLNKPPYLPADSGVLQEDGDAEYGDTWLVWCSDK